MLYSVLTARIILNIRNTGDRGAQTELHTCYIETLSLVAMPIQLEESSDPPQDDTVGLEIQVEDRGGDANDTPALP
jgi:hypothetical protein